jgi:hypothetical protein
MTTTGIELDFTEGHRDQTIFHIGNCLKKGGMSTENLIQMLHTIGKMCSPPFPEKEIEAKIESILKRSDESEKSLSQDVLEWICRQSGVFMSSDVVNELGLSSRVAKKNLSKILNRFCEPEHGHIEKYGKKRGCFRVIDRSYQEQKWWNDEGIPLAVKFPLGVEEFAKVFPGNIVLLEGQKSQGKSAFALEFCRMNKGLFSKKTMYQNVEMSDSELIDRFRAYGDIMSFSEWKENVLFIRQTSDWWDKIVPDGLNVVDYLIEYKEPYLLADYVFEIHKRLKTGICLLVVQRDPFKQYPSGGRAVRDIPRLIISLIKHRLKLEDVKSFHQTAYGNPTGLSRKYKQISWWNFRADSGWELEMEKKNVEY